MYSGIDYNDICQIGILTHNIEKTTQEYAAMLGVEVPEIITSEEYETTQAVYRGQPCSARIYQSFFNFNNTQIELIQPVDDTPSIWRECLDNNGEGLHHIAFNVKDMPEVIEDCEKQGMLLLQKGEYTGGRYAYLDDRSARKVILEFLEND